LLELHDVFPRRFRQLATPATAKRLADLLGLLWKNKLEHSDPKLGNIVYFKGKLGLIDWKHLGTVDLDFKRATLSDFKNYFELGTGTFYNLLNEFARANPAAWRFPRQQGIAIFRRLISHLPVPASKRAEVFNLLLQSAQARLAQRR